MKLYHTPRAPSPERVVQFLRVKDRLHAIDIAELSIIKLEHKSEAYRAVSPFGQVPALELDDGTVITETRAICTFFEGLFPDPNLMGAGPREKALIEMWDRRVELMLLAQFAAWFRNAHPALSAIEKPQIPEAAEKGERRAKAFANKLDAHLAGNDWLAANRFTIADITLKITCEFAAAMKWKPQEELPNLKAWYSRVVEKVPS